MDESIFCDIHPSDGPALAIAYVPEQKWRNLYTPDVGFEQGTVFSELDKPFLGEEAACHD